MAKKRKSTQLQKEYAKARRRVQQQIRRMEKKGYVSIKPLLPDMPKRVTRKAIERLNAITPESLYEKSVKIDVETGEVIAPALDALKESRRQAARKAAQTRRQRVKLISQAPEPQVYLPSFSRIVISNFRVDVVSRFPESAGPILERWLNRLIAQSGEDPVARMLEDAAKAGIIIDFSVAYNNELLMGRIADMMEFFDDMTDRGKADLLEELEFAEDWEVPL